MIWLRASIRRSRNGYGRPARSTMSSERGRTGRVKDLWVIETRWVATQPVGRPPDEPGVGGGGGLGVSPMGSAAGGGGTTGGATGSGSAEVPSSRALTSLARYRRCPPRVRTELNLPAFAHRVTVFGSTRNIAATSAGVSSGSESPGSRVITSDDPGLKRTKQPICPICSNRVGAPPNVTTTRIALLLTQAIGVALIGHCSDRTVWSSNQYYPVCTS